MKIVYRGLNHDTMNRYLIQPHHWQLMCVRERSRWLVCGVWSHLPPCSWSMSSCTGPQWSSSCSWVEAVYVGTFTCLLLRYEIAVSFFCGITVAHVGGITIFIVVLKLPQWILYSKTPQHNDVLITWGVLLQQISFLKATYLFLRTCKYKPRAHDKTGEE